MLQSDCPAGNNRTILGLAIRNRICNRLSIVRTHCTRKWYSVIKKLLVENSAIRQRTFIIYGYKAIEIGLLTIPLFNQFGKNIAITGFRIPFFKTGFIHFCLEGNVLFQFISFSFNSFSIIVIILTRRYNEDTQQHQRDMQVFLHAFIPLSFLINSSCLPSRR